MTAAFGMEEGTVAAVSAVFAADASAAATTDAAISGEPVADFARAAGVLSSPLVEAITGPATVAVFAGLAAGAPESGFFGGAGLKESRIFSAAAASCERMCGICSKTVSAGNRSFIKRGMTCCRNSP